MKFNYIVFFVALLIPIESYAHQNSKSYHVKACKGKTVVGVRNYMTANSWCSGGVKGIVNVSNSHSHSPPEEEITDGLDSILSRKVLSKIESGDIRPIASLFSQGAETNNEMYAAIKNNTEVLYNCFAYFYGVVGEGKVRERKFEGEKLACEIFNGEREIIVDGSDDKIIVHSAKPILVTAIVNSSGGLTGVYIPADAVLKYPERKMCLVGD